MQKAYRLAFPVIGALIAVPIIVSLIQYSFNLRLAPNLDLFVSVYRAIVTTVFGPIYALVGALLGLGGIQFTAPGWLYDLHILSFICAGIYLQSAYNAEDQHEAIDGAPKPEANKPLRIAGRIAFFLFSGLVGIGLFWSLSVLLRIIGHWVEEDDKLIAKAGWATIFAVGLFYALNYLLLQFASGAT